MLGPDIAAGSCEGTAEQENKTIRAKENRLGERLVRASQGRVGEVFCARKKGGDGLSAIVLNMDEDLTPQFIQG